MLHAQNCCFGLLLGFTLEAELVSSKHLIQLHLKILSRSVENMASYLLTKYIYLKYKLSIIFYTKIIYAYHKRDCARQKLKLWGLCSEEEFFVV